MKAWHEFEVNKENHTIINDCLNSTRCQQIQLNRHYIKCVAEVTLLCCCLEIGLRGHDESYNSVNKGNFREIIQLVANHDPVIKQRLEHGPQNVTYLSPDIQLDLLQVMGDMVRNSITEDVHKAGYYSLLADESKDISKTEQMAVVVRYTDETAVIYEKFFTFVEVKDLTAAGL